MGVQGLWDIVSPVARDTNLESLRNKRLAVDASIWIYQFMLAVRTEKGDQMPNSHIVGFFRRICKLLWFGIKPVFVFDGGVPELKRRVIASRKKRREEKEESLERIAARILAKRLQGFADEQIDNSSGSTGKVSNKSPKRTKSQAQSNRIQRNTDEYQAFEVYYDDLYDEDQLERERQNKENESKMFRKQDDYDLPYLEKIEKDKNDRRFQHEGEYDTLSREVQEELDNVDMNSVDPTSPEFSKLPLSTQYIILSHLRLRSRLRLGYTKDQLEQLFPDNMEFSKFQIQMVQKRNFFTQKLMTATGMSDDQDVIQRQLASDKGKAYDLRRIDGGYALEIENKSGHQNKELLDDEIGFSEDEEEEEFDWDEINNPAVKGQDGVTVEDTKDRAKLDGSNSSNAIEIEDSGSEAPDHHKTEEVIEVLSGDEKGNQKKNQSESLFIEDNGSSSDDDSEFDADDFEDVPVADIEDNEELDAKIKSLYEYAEKNNSKQALSINGDYTREEEEAIERLEEEELKKAIEQSKNDYLHSLENEKKGKIEPLNSNEPPIFLSSESLSKGFLSKFKIKDNPLFGGKKTDSVTKSKIPAAPTSTAKKDIKPEKDDLEIAQQKDTDSNKPKAKAKALPLPLPDWFQHSNIPQKKETVSEAPLPEVEILDGYDDGLGDSSGEEAEGEVEEEVKVVDVAPVASGGFDGEIDLTRASDEPSTPDLSEDETASYMQTPATVQTDLTDDESQREDIDEDLIIDLPQETANHNAFLQQIKATKSPTLDSFGTFNGNGKGEIASDFIGKPVLEKPIIVNEDDEIWSDEEENNGNNSAKWDMEEERKLQEELKKAKRGTDEVTTQMIIEVQELLKRFGIPFITAPMEAEAQCAELKILNLVDGIVTDDSDCFLFGGDWIYRHMFTDRVMAECYTRDDLEVEMGLDREKFIELAIMLGSDYTEGLKGIGKVMAMEILGDFGSIGEFKKWWMLYQKGNIDPTKDTAVRRKLRASLKKKLFLDDSFPNYEIVVAYTDPVVDSDTTEFKWGKPDLNKLLTYMEYQVGWPKKETEDLLNPVLKNMQLPQSTVEQFFKRGQMQRNRKLHFSKRISDAVVKLKRRGKNNEKSVLKRKNGGGGAAPAADDGELLENIDWSDWSDEEQEQEQEQEQETAKLNKRTRLP